jgi:Reverse transcriptase (RNA-dependent DNA polymerase).
VSDSDPSPIQLDQICHLSSIIKTGEELKYQARIDIDWLLYFNDLVNNAHHQIDQEDERINKLTPMKLTTRKYIMNQPDATEWVEAEFKQLDTHDRDKMYDKLCPRPKYAIVLRSNWTYSRKTSGEYKARQCMDGRPLRQDSIRRLESIYTACISQVGTKIFFATCALLNFVIMDLDAVNAFGQAGSLYKMVHIEIDQQYRTWYKHRYGYIIPNGYVLPVKGSLQGHPDSGEIWQTKVNSILSSYNFTTTTHEPCLYRGTYRGEFC